MSALEHSAGAGRCGVRHRFSGPCDLPPVHLVSAGCIHEHIKTEPMCARHIAQLEAGIVACAQCSHSDDPHDCPVQGRIVGELVVRS